jgi:ferredoxin
MTYSLRLGVNPVACSGHGVCAELLPELITLDEWGYPLPPQAAVPARLSRQARRAVRDCPALALYLAETKAGDGARQTSFRGNAEDAQRAVVGSSAIVEP